MALIRSTLDEDIYRYASRLVAAASVRAEVAVKSDPRVPVGRRDNGGSGIRLGPKLAESFRFERAPRRHGTRVTVTARNVAPHARYTVEGTTPHVIVPVRARVLRFEQRGVTRFAMRVHHPGNAPSSWWDDVLADHWPRSLSAAALLL